MTSWVPCERCGSTGEVRDSRVTIALVPCPACSGLGELPSDGLVEAATAGYAVAYFDLGTAEGFHFDEETTAGIRAALVAARLYTQNLLIQSDLVVRENG